MKDRSRSHQIGDRRWQLAPEADKCRARRRTGEITQQEPAVDEKEDPLLADAPEVEANDRDHCVQ